MKENSFYVRNGESFAIDRVPVLSVDMFRDKIVGAVFGGMRLLNLFGCCFEPGNIRIFAVLGDDSEGRLMVFSKRMISNQTGFQSITPLVPQAHLFEREIAEQFGIIPEGHPWLKPVRFHPEGDAFDPYSFFKIQGDEIHEVGVGPVHAGIIEPGHFRFQCLGEEILHLEIRLGYQHRGLEKMMIQPPIKRCLMLSESIAGDTAIGHSTAFCNVMEALSGCNVSPRALSIRSIALELERLACHTGDLGALCGDIGFLPSASYFGRLRGVFLNLTADLCGSRLGRSLCCPGGVIFDLDEDMAKDFRKQLTAARKDLNDIAKLMLNSPSVLARLEGTGTVSHQASRDLGLVGPAARASGCEIDTRAGYASGMYSFHHIPIASVASGDVYARALIRWIESQRSIDFLLNILSFLPQGPVLVKTNELQPDHMAIGMVEGWRGEIMHVAITDKSSRIIRYKIKDPSFHNWPALAIAVRGAQISDFPLCNKSFNLSYAGHDL